MSEDNLFEQFRSNLESGPVSLGELADFIFRWRESKGFYTPEGIHGEQNADDMLGKLMLVSTEISEAAEAVRKGDQQNYEEELADTMIRILDICGTQGIPIEDVIRAKMKVNLDREYRHGKEATL